MKTKEKCYCRRAHCPPSNWILFYFIAKKHQHQFICEHFKCHFSKENPFRRFGCRKTARVCVRVCVWEWEGESSAAPTQPIFDGYRKTDNNEALRSKVNYVINRNESIFERRHYTSTVLIICMDENHNWTAANHDKCWFYGYILDRTVDVMEFSVSLRHMEIDVHV